MEVKVLDIKQITRDFIKKQLHDSENLSKKEIDEYLDMLSAINKKQFVYNINTPQGDFILYITAKPSIINLKK